MQLLRLRQIHNGVFIKVPAAAPLGSCMQKGSPQQGYQRCGGYHVFKVGCACHSAWSPLLLMPGP